MEYRNDATDPQAGDAFLQSHYRFSFPVGLEDGLAEAGEVVPMFFRLVYPQEGRGRRQVKLELAHGVLLAQMVEQRHQARGQGRAIPLGKGLLDFRRGGIQFTHGHGQLLPGADFRQRVGIQGIEFTPFRVGNHVRYLMDDQGDDEQHAQNQGEDESGGDAMTDGKLTEHGLSLQNIRFGDGSD